MINTVLIKSYAPPPFDRREILRYSGVRGDAPEICRLAESCISEAEGKFSYRVCYSEFPVLLSDECADVGFAKIKSLSARKYFEGCDRMILFAATVGLGIDRLVARYASTSPSRSLLFQAIGAERIESLCDLFCDDMANKAVGEGYFARRRFSPGYGDIPLSLQKDIFDVLGCQKHLGVSLNESLLMSPTKSVTAFIGLSRSDGCS